MNFHLSCFLIRKKIILLGILTLLFILIFFNIRVWEGFYRKLKWNYWRYHKKTYLNILQNPYYKIEEFLDGSASRKYFDVISRNTIKCKNMLTIDKHIDNGISICNDKQYQFIPTDCIFYSFNVDYLWSFDDYLSSQYNCVVRTFIPSKGNYFVVKRLSNVMFYNYGLGKYDETLESGWNIRRFSSLLVEFNEHYRVIDLLKISLDYAEWDALQTMFDDESLYFVKQIIFDSHTEEIQGRQTQSVDFIRFLNIWNHLHNIGFRQWYSRKLLGGYYKYLNLSSTENCCTRHHLINIHYL